VGFDEEHLPEKTWLMNVLFTKNPNHKTFKYVKNQNIVEE